LINEGESLFSLGYLSLHERALIEVIYTKIIHKINELLKKCKNIPDELNGFDLNLCETYFTNFSLFQSLPDSWAIDQLFPIMPIHRLKEKPEVIARIADITCDSDGQINKFVGEEGEQDYLLLHNLNDGEEYYLGFFLVGAYQEILGDLHNLFGDTNAVHISFNKKTGYKIDSVIIGDTVSESLKYVQYSSREILKNIREHLEKSVSKKIITIEESIIFLERFQKTLNDYTYFFK
jgi:arginine decarboxylase